MLFSTIEPFFKSPRSTPQPSMALTMLAGTVKPSFSPAYVKLTVMTTPTITPSATPANVISR